MKNESKWQSKRMLGPFDPSESGTPFHWFCLSWEGEITFGRDPNQTQYVFLKERVPQDYIHLSRKHLSMKKQSSGDVIIIDHSSNGTFINRTLVGRVRQYPLTHFCTISLGLPGLNIFTFINNEALKVQANIRVNPNP